VAGLRDGQEPAGLDRLLVCEIEDMAQLRGTTAVQPSADRTQESEGPTPGVRLSGFPGLLLPSRRLPESPVLGRDGRRQDLRGVRRPPGDLGADAALDEVQPTEGALAAEPGIDDLSGTVEIPARCQGRPDPAPDPGRSCEPCCCLTLRLSLRRPDGCR
jgi:hypothetical protein